MKKLTQEEVDNFGRAMKTARKRDILKLFYVNIFNPRKRNRIFDKITKGMSIQGAIISENPYKK